MSTPSTIVLNADVYAFIMQYLDRHSLASAARVSGWWHDSACALLYKKLNSPYPLIRLLPLNSGDTPGDGFMVLSPIPDESLKTFRSKAALVREISWTQEELLSCSKCINIAFNSIQQLDPSAIIFPNLLTLRVKCLTAARVACIESFLSPTLVSVKIRIGAEVTADGGEVVRMLSQLQRYAANLEVFSFYMEENAQSPEVLEFLTALKSNSPRLVRISPKTVLRLMDKVDKSTCVHESS